MAPPTGNLPCPGWKTDTLVEIAIRFSFKLPAFIRTHDSYVYTYRVVSRVFFPHCCFFMHMCVLVL